MMLQGVDFLAIQGADDLSIADFNHASQTLRGRLAQSMNPSDLCFSLGSTCFELV
jgi:hypothetical protein